MISVQMSLALFLLQTTELKIHEGLESECFIPSD